MFIPNGVYGDLVVDIIVNLLNIHRSFQFKLILHNNVRLLICNVWDGNKLLKHQVDPVLKKREIEFRIYKIKREAKESV